MPIQGRQRSGPSLAEKSHARDAPPVHLPPPSRRAARLLAACGLAACAGAPTLMQYHRSVLDPLAQRELDCERLEVADATPEGFRYGDDADARRYRVTGCGADEAYLCSRPSRTQFSSATPECRRLPRTAVEGRSRAAPGGVSVGGARLRE